MKILKGTMGADEVVSAVTAIIEHFEPDIGPHAVNLAAQLVQALLINTS